MPSANLKFAAFFNSSVAILTDVVFALLPVPILWNVQMNWRVKSAVAAILSLGIFAAVAAIVKVTFLGAYGQHGDFLWDSADITIWYAQLLRLSALSLLPSHALTVIFSRTTVEICIAIIAASFPCLKPLAKRLLDSTSPSGRYGTSKYRGYVRNDTGPTPKSNAATAPRSQTASEFEMYSRGAKFTTDVKTGTPSITGSEESILPQDPKTQPQRSDGGITKTSTVFVSFDKRETRSGGGWEGEEPGRPSISRRES